ncbi:MAG: hypothetical protein ACJAZO_004878 [Myxococcota bacterium]|jgi:hypothetical protein
MIRTAWFLCGAAVLAISLACGGDDSSPGFTTVAAATGVCPSNAVTAASWSEGTRVTLVAIHPDDAYAAPEGDWLRRLPISGVVSGSDMSLQEDCWMGGPFESDSGDSYYFHKGAFTMP